MRSVKDECLAKLILVGEPALRTALRGYVEHFHGERNHQGKGNLLLFPCEEMGQHGPVRLPRASRGPPEVLLPTGRMSFLTTRSHCRDLVQLPVAA